MNNLKKWMAIGLAAFLTVQTSVPAFAQEQSQVSAAQEEAEAEVSAKEGDIADEAVVEEIADGDAVEDQVKTQSHVVLVRTDDGSSTWELTEEDFIDDDVYTMELPEGTAFPVPVEVSVDGGDNQYYAFQTAEDSMQLKGCDWALRVKAADTANDIEEDDYQNQEEDEQALSLDDNESGEAGTDTADEAQDDDAKKEDASEDMISDTENASVTEHTIQYDADGYMSDLYDWMKNDDGVYEITLYEGFYPVEEKFTIDDAEVTHTFTSDEDVWDIFEDGSHLVKVNAPVLTYNLGKSAVPYFASDFADSNEQTIYLGTDPFYPYEVQFKDSEGSVTKWFMTPDSSVEFAGHTFKTSADFTGERLTQLTLHVGDNDIVVYPEKKSFIENNGMIVMRSVLMPLREVTLDTVDLTGLTPFELANIKVTEVLGNTESDGSAVDGKQVVWREEGGNDDTKDIYTISDGSGTLDFSRNLGSTSHKYQIIVGTADQLDASNVRYIVNTRTTSIASWFKSSNAAADKDGSRISYDASLYFSRNGADVGTVSADDVASSRILSVSTKIPGSYSSVGLTPYIAVQMDNSIFSGTRTTSVTTVRVFEGNYTSTQELSAHTDADITEQLLAQDFTTTGTGYAVTGDNNNKDITLVGYTADGTAVGCYPMELRVSFTGQSSAGLSLYAYMYKNVETGSSSNYELVSADNTCKENTEQKGEYTLTISLYQDAPLDGEYYLRMGSYDADSIKSVYPGNYGSEADAKAAGAQDLRGNSSYEITGYPGYLANYANGATFTIIGTDSRVQHVLVQVEAADRQSLNVSFYPNLYDVARGRSARTTYSSSRQDNTFSITEKLYKEYPANTQLGLGIVVSNYPGTVTVKGVYEGTYDSVQAAEDAGKTDIKDQVIQTSYSFDENKTYYQADFSNGIDLTAIITKDGIEGDQVYHLTIKTEEGSSNIISFYGNLYDIGGSNVSSVVANGHSSTEDADGNHVIDMELYNDYSVNASLGLDLSFYQYGGSNSRVVTAVYVGAYDSVEAIPADAENIRDKTIAHSSTAGTSYEDRYYIGDFSQGITFTVVYTDGEDSAITHVIVKAHTGEETNTSFSGRLYDVVSGNQQATPYIFTSSYKDGVHQLDISLYREYDANQELGLDLNYNFGYSKRNDEVTAIYEGNYASSAAAAADGKADIKEQLIHSSNSRTNTYYTKNYSSGVTFTVIAKDKNSQVERVSHLVVTAATGTYSVLSNSNTLVTFTGLLDANKESIPCYIADMSDDDYAQDNFITYFVNEDVDLGKVIPVFSCRQTIKLFVAGGGEVTSGDTVLDFSSDKAFEFTASSEDKKNSANYWVRILKPSASEVSGQALYLTSLDDETDSNTTVNDDGSVDTTRTIYLDSLHDSSVHNIIVANRSQTEIPNLSVEMSADSDFTLDEFWTLTGDNALPGFTTAQKPEGNQYGGLANLAKIRLHLKDGVESGEDIKGTLTLKSGAATLMTIHLTGTVGDPQIVTDAVPDGVKYVPYGVMIQNSNKYSWNHLSYTVSADALSGDDDGENGIYYNKLPSGVTLYPNGELSGVPTEAGTYHFVVVMKNTSLFYGSRQLDDSTKEYTLNIADNTDSNVEGATDSGYDVEDYIGTSDDVSTHTVYEGDGDQVFHSAGEYSTFTAIDSAHQGFSSDEGHVYIDGQELTAGTDYTSEEGSTKITIKEQTLAKYGEGKHTLGVKFDWKDGQVMKAAQNYTYTKKTTPTPTATPSPTATVTPTTTPSPTATVTPTTTPRPTTTPSPTSTPRPTTTPSPTSTPRPTSTPSPTTTPRPTTTPLPTTTPVPTATPLPTSAPRTTTTPSPTATPGTTGTPTPTVTPQTTTIPTSSPDITPTQTPSSSTDNNGSQTNNSDTGTSVAPNNSNTSNGNTTGTNGNGSGSQTAGTTVPENSSGADGTGTTSGTGVNETSAADTTAETQMTEVRPIRYTIRTGDTLRNIAARYYGDEGHYLSIFAANRRILRSENLIYPGQIITLPVITLPDGTLIVPTENGGINVKPATDAQDDKTTPQSPTTQTNSAVVDDGTYTVRRNDTLQKIARRAYGDPSRWRDIYNANRDKIRNPNLIYPGQKLVIPR